MFIFMKTIKTVNWMGSKELFTVSARQRFGKARPLHPRHFVEFIEAYNTVPLKAMTAFLEKIIMRNDLEDYTKWAETSEDACLFSLDSEAPAVLSIVDRYLRQLNVGAQVPALWCYVDDEKKVVAHFVSRKGWFVELYVQSVDEDSALHLVDTVNGKYFVPVVFTADLNRYAQAADLRGSLILHDYLPREKFDFLSKGGKRGKGNHCLQKKFPLIDNGDSL